MLTTCRNSLVRQRLYTGTVSGHPRTYFAKPTEVDPVTATAAELGPTTHLPYPNHANFSPTAVVQWQIEQHPGFIPAFISAVRHAPITNQHASWTRIGQRLLSKRTGEAKEGFAVDKVLMLFGSTDPLIKVEEVGVDAVKCFGEENTVIKVFNGGHEIPLSHAEEMVHVMLEYWS
jgi:hypothetical protein